MVRSNELPLAKKVEASWVAFLRIFIGAFWLLEVTIGHNWKTGSFFSGSHPGWFGPKAGSYIIEQGEAGINAGGWEWFGWILKNIIYPYAAEWGYFAAAVQLFFAFAFLFGFMVRPAALLGLGMDFFIYMLGNSRIPPFFTVSHLFVLATNAGMYYGVDGLWVEKLKQSKTRLSAWTKSLLTLDFVNLKMLRIVGYACAVLAFYYLIKIADIETAKIKGVSLDLAVLFGFSGFGLLMYKPSVDRIAYVSSLLRIWLGYRLLREIVITKTAALNSLANWSNASGMKELFETISEKHFPLVSSIVDAVFVPFAGYWAFFLAVVQTVIAVMLILGIRTRLIGKAGMVFLGMLIILGFTRYAPFVFGLLVGMTALGGGRMFAVYSGKEREDKLGFSISKPAVIVCFAGSILGLIAANAGGIQVNGYTTSMGAFMAAIVGIFCFLLAVTGVLQHSESLFARKDRKPAANHEQPLSQ